jgi:hypothetical protein
LQSLFSEVIPAGVSGACASPDPTNQHHNLLPTSLYGAGLSATGRLYNQICNFSRVAHTTLVCKRHTMTHVAALSQLIQNSNPPTELQMRLPVGNRRFCGKPVWAPIHSASSRGKTVPCPSIPRFLRNGWEMMNSTAGTPDPSHLGTWETTIPMARKRHPPGRQALCRLFPHFVHNDSRSLPSNIVLGDLFTGCPWSLAFGDRGDHAKVAIRGQNVS